MDQGYFRRLYKLTPTRMWINNPSRKDCENAINAGAINCTTNPQYCHKLFSSDPEYIQSVIDEILLKKTTDHDEAASRVYQVVTKCIMEKFLPLYEKSEGRVGYVTMQDDPRKDQDTEAIINTVHRNKKLSPNYMVKIPVIDGGIQAIEQCVKDNIPICATEVFSIAQTVDICEMYEYAVKRFGNHPPFYVTHISGIFDDYLQIYAKRYGINIKPEVIAYAGNTIARKEYQLIKNKGYMTTMLVGGVRALYHFTEMVGGDVHITINWNDADALIKQDGSISSAIENETPKYIVEELCDKLKVFRQAYMEDGLRREEYADYGPVQLFRNAFMMGWFFLLSEISRRRRDLGI